MKRKKKGKFLKPKLGPKLGIAALVLILLTVLVFLRAGDVYLYKDTASIEALPEVDAIVVLGGGRGRISAAGDVWYRYWTNQQQPANSALKIPVLYFAGMGHQLSWGRLSKQLRKGVLEAAKPEQLILERESLNTDANAQWLARTAKQRGWTKILLMTSTYHMKRAEFIFTRYLKRQEYPVEVQTLSVYQEPYSKKAWKKEPNSVRVTLLEYLKWIYYRNFWWPSPF